MAADPELAAELAGRVEGAELRAGFGQAAALVPLARWHEAALVARDDLGCAQFDWLGAEDAGGPRSAGADHTVLLHVVASGRGLLLRTTVEPGGILPGVADVWAGADWPQREVAEMFGVRLAGGEPARLLLADSFEGHPLRKDFALASRGVRPWPGRLEPGEDEGSPGRRRRLVPPGTPGPTWGRT